MSQIMNPQESYKLSPEALEFTQVYLSNLNIRETANILDISIDEVNTFLRKKEVKRFLDNVFLEQGYTSRFKIKDVLTTIVESKLEEAEETGVYTGKDLLDVLKMLMDLRKQETPQEAPQQTNVQINNNLSSLISDLVNAES